MAIKSIAKGNKNKNFTFRVTEALTNDIAEVKAKCDQHGLRLNLTEALTSALEKELKALQKHIQTIEPSWEPRQLLLLKIVSAKASAKDKQKPKS
jgi:hypothetical protein